MMTDLEDSDLGQPAPVKLGIDLYPWPNIRKVKEIAYKQNNYYILSSNYKKHRQFMENV